MAFLILSLVVVLLHGYVGWRLSQAESHPLVRRVFVGLMVLSAASLATGLLLKSGDLATTAPLRALAWVRYTLLGFFSTVFCLLVLRDAGVLSVRLWAKLRRHRDPVLCAMVERCSARVLIGLAVLATAVGFWQAVKMPDVVRVDIPLAALPPEMDGFTIAQISDLHVGPTIRRDRVAEVVAAVNAASPDLVAITGDLVDGSVAALGSEVAPLRDLRSRFGTYFVTGNHEYYSGAGEWVQALPSLGMKVLMNDHVLLQPTPSHRLLLAGVPDVTGSLFVESLGPEHRSDPALARGQDAAEVAVLLAHQPRAAFAAAAAGFDLQLSGHTHGGQFWPWGLLVPLQQPFVVGLHSLGKMQVFVTRGAGYWGPPNRLGSPSEIVLVTLRAVPPPFSSGSGAASSSAQ